MNDKENPNTKIEKTDIEQVDTIDTTDVTQRAVVGPKTDELKARFKAQSIPLEQDFANLIDIADCGRTALGLNPEQDGKLANGFEFDDNGKLKIKISGSSILISDSGISVARADASIISMAGTGLKVVAKDGLVTDSEGLKVKAGKGVQVDTNGVSLTPENILPKGTIVMYSGTEADIPSGWAICDGRTSNGVQTPNLIDRFILGGDMAGLGGKSDKTVTGPKDAKIFSVTSANNNVNVSVSIGGTALDVKHLPAHKHVGGETWKSTATSTTSATWVESAFSYGSVKTDTDKKCLVWFPNFNANDNGRYFAFAWDNTTLNYHAYTNEIGGNQTHTHTATVNNATHTHAITVNTPYYILVFIMKVV